LEKLEPAAMPGKVGIYPLGLGILSLLLPLSNDLAAPLRSIDEMPWRQLY